MKAADLYALNALAVLPIAENCCQRECPWCGFRNKTKEIKNETEDPSCEKKENHADGTGQAAPCDSGKDCGVGG